LGLASFPQRELYERSVRGSSGLFSIETVTTDKDKIFDFTNRLKLFGRGISWGGFESLVTASHVQPSGYDAPAWFVRLFCGLEDPQDLINDIARALPALR
ncbi:MAG TPA: PLP-dependent transferase, partial [Fimbriimonas sp.]|nr:PLP-dependent transferase [Fimbriimonas sp.]